MKDPELDGKVGFKIGEHLNGTAAAKPFSYDILRRISFSSLSVQYVSTLRFEYMKSDLRQKNKIGSRYQACPKQFASLKLVA